MSKTNKVVVLGVMGVLLLAMIGVSVFASTAHAAVGEPRAGAVVVKTGMELAGRSTDGAIAKYVDYDANVVCYRTLGTNFSYQPNSVALSCVNL